MVGVGVANPFRPVLSLAASWHRSLQECQVLHYTLFVLCLAIAELSRDRSCLRKLYPTLNPAALLRQIQTRQEALWKLAIRPAGATMESGA